MINSRQSFAGNIANNAATWRIVVTIKMTNENVFHPAVEYIEKKQKNRRKIHMTGRNLDEYHAV